MKVVFFSVIFLLAFLYQFYVKKNRGINVIVFSIPFSYTPFYNNLIGELLPISISGILVVLCYLLTYTREKRYFHTPQFRNLKRILWFYLSVGILVSFMYYSDANNLTSHVGYVTSLVSKLSPVEQVIYNALNLLFCIMFLDLLRSHFQIKENINSVARIFSLTIIPMFFYQTLQMTGNSDIFGSVLTPTMEVNAYDTRYFSLYTVFGFGIYVAMVIVFSLYFRFKYYFITLILGLLFGLFSGERQALVFPIVVLFVYYIFNKGNFWIKSLKMVVLSGFLFLLLFLLKDQFNGIARLWISIGLTQDNQVLAASGRDVQGIPFIIDALKTWPFWGKGLYNWGYFIGVKSYYADHVVLFNIYQKFGLVGFLLFIGAILHILLTTFKKLYISKNKPQYAMILGLIISFIGMQFLDNFFWFTNTMLLYIFMFSLIFSLNDQSSELKIV